MTPYRYLSIKCGQCYFSECLDRRRACCSVLQNHRLSWKPGNLPRVALSLPRAQPTVVLWGRRMGKLLRNRLRLLQEWLRKLVKMIFKTYDCGNFLMTTFDIRVHVCFRFLSCECGAFVPEQFVVNGNPHTCMHEKYYNVIFSPFFP